MKKVLARSKGGRTLVAYGWIEHRVADGAGVRGPEPLSRDLVEQIKLDPDLMDFIDLNYYGPNLYRLAEGAKAITFTDQFGRKQVIAG